MVVKERKRNTQKEKAVVVKKIEVKKVGMEYVRGQSYFFNPPIKANCFPVGNGGKGKRAEFVRGWYVGYVPEEKAYVFEGIPEKWQAKNRRYYFYVPCDAL